MKIFYIVISAMMLLSAGGCGPVKDTRSYAGDYDYKDGYVIEDESSIPMQQISGGAVTVYAWGTENDTIRIRAVRTGTVFNNSPFLLTIPASGSVPVQSGSGWTIGSYTITPVTDGYELRCAGEFMYRSVFTVSGSTVTESITSNSAGDPAEYFSGMGSSSTSVVKGSSSYSIRNRPAFGGQTYMYIPFFFSSAGSAFYRNAATDDTVSFGEPGSGTVTVSSAGGSIDGYFYHSGSPKEAVAKFYSVSGSKSLLPRWAYGFIQSKYGYRSQAEVESVVSRFGTEGIPLSAIVLDLYWFKTMGDFSWNASAFPDPEGMADYLESKGVKLITITEPYVLNGSSSYDYFDSTRSMVEDSSGKSVTTAIWLGVCGMLNPLSKSAMECIGSKYSSFFDSGVDGFWTDLGEPEADAEGGYFDAYTMDYFHNYYNREWSRLIRLAMKKSHPDARPFILSRSGFTGSAGYGVSHWSGDIPSTFPSLSDQIALGINDGLAGFSYWGCDVGGFLGEPSDELFVRWMQFGAFTPVFRAHGSDSVREPWRVSGSKFDAVKECIAQRYRLLPYIYSAAWQTASAGVPMMRPLTLEFPSDSSLYGSSSSYLSSEYMFGDSLLVAPVTQEGASSRSVYLPAGEWYLLSDYSPYAAGVHSVPVSISGIPVFVRKGAVIPFDENADGVTDTVYLFPSSASTDFLWYEDDGLTNGYQSGEGESIAVSLRPAGVSFSGVKIPRDVTLKILTDPAASAAADKFTLKSVSLAAGTTDISL